MMNSNKATFYMYEEKFADKIKEALQGKHLESLEADFIIQLCNNFNQGKHHMRIEPLFIRGEKSADFHYKRMNSWVIFKIRDLYDESDGAFAIVIKHTTPHSVLLVKDIEDAILEWVRPAFAESEYGNSVVPSEVIEKQQQSKCSQERQESYNKVINRLIEWLESQRVDDISFVNNLDNFENNNPSYSIRCLAVLRHSDRTAFVLSLSSTQIKVFDNPYVFKLYRMHESNAFCRDSAFEYYANNEHDSSDCVSEPVEESKEPVKEVKTYYDMIMSMTSKELSQFLVTNMLLPDKNGDLHQTYITLDCNAYTDAIDAIKHNREWLADEAVQSVYVRH